MQAEFKSFMYIDRSLRTKKYKFIDELNFKKCMPLKRSLKSKFFVGITNKQKNIYHPSWFYGWQWGSEGVDILIKKIPERPPEIKKTKEENRLEKSKIKKERAALEWYDIDMQAELKSFMYIDHSLRKKIWVDEWIKLQKNVCN